MVFYINAKYEYLFIQQITFQIRYNRKTSESMNHFLRFCTPYLLNDFHPNYTLFLIDKDTTFISYSINTIYLSI